jgi:toxin ParE1/3/4
VTLVLRWSNAARRDLLDIWRWRGRERPELGDRALDRIEKACERLLSFPHLGPPFPQMHQEARRLNMDGYLAFYRIERQVIFIVRVVDQRRLLEEVSFDEG